MFFLLIASVNITFCAYGMLVQGAIIPKPIIANGTGGFIDGIKNAFSKEIITPDVFKKLVNNREYVEAYQVLANFSEYVDQTECVDFVARNIVRILRSIRFINFM